MLSAPRVRHPTTSSSKRSELSTLEHRGMGCIYVSRKPLRAGRRAPDRLAVGAGAPLPVERDDVVHVRALCPTKLRGNGSPFNFLREVSLQTQCRRDIAGDD